MSLGGELACPVVGDEGVDDGPEVPVDDDGVEVGLDGRGVGVASGLDVIGVGVG